MKFNTFCEVLTFKLKHINTNMTTFRIYIFSSTEFKSNEYRLGTTQIDDLDKFKQSWHTKFRNITVKYMSDKISITKQAYADSLLKTYTDTSHRITLNFKTVVDIADNVERLCQNLFKRKMLKEELYLKYKLERAQDIKSRSLLDVVSDDEEPNTSDEEFIDNDDEIDDSDYNEIDEFIDLTNDR